MYYHVFLLSVMDRGGGGGAKGAHAPWQIDYDPILGYYMFSCICKWLCPPPPPPPAKKLLGGGGGACQLIPLERLFMVPPIPKTLDPPLYMSLFIG